MEDETKQNERDSQWRATLKNLYGNARISKWPCDAATNYPGAPDVMEYLNQYCSDNIDYLTIEKLGTDGKISGAPDAFETKYGELILDRFSWLTRRVERDEKINGKFTYKKVWRTESAVFTCGRSGKTCAPSALYDDRRHVAPDLYEISSDPETQKHAINFVDQFNAYIDSLAEGFAEHYEEHVDDLRAQDIRDRADRAAKLRAQRAAARAERDGARRRKNQPRMRVFAR